MLARLSSAPDPTLDADRDERRYRSLLQAFSDIVWVTGADGRLMTDMPAWRAVTGQTAEELLGFGWLDGVHPEDRERTERVWAASMRTGSPYAIEYRITGPGGTRHLEVRGAAVRGPDGEIEEWIGWCADVSTRAELASALAADRSALDLVIEQAPVAMAVVWGPDHHYRLFNSGYEELVPPGRTLTGKTVIQALPEATAAIELLDRAYAGEEVVLREFPIPFADARSFEGNRYYDFTYTPIHDGGPPAGVLVVAVERTEEVRLRSDLERRLVAERAVAEQLQRAVLPEEPPAIEGLELAVRYLAAAEESGVGGDWHDVVVLPDGHVLLVIGDVAGRGLPAATVMVQLRSAVRVFAVEGGGPAQILARLARHCLALELADFVTVLVGIVDPGAGRLVYASAGHPPLLLVPADGEPEILWAAAGPPIGAPPAGHREAELRLAPGDAVILYTDGLVEERGRPLDETLEELRQTAGGDADDLDALCDRLLRGRRPADDTALLACRRVAVAVAAAVPGLEARFPAEPVSVSAVRAAVGEVAAAAGLDDDGVGRVKLAVSEAATNAVLHAYCEAPVPGDVEVRAAVVDGELRVVIADEGAGMRPRNDSPGLGLGLGMITALAGRVDFVNPGLGTEVHMAWRLG